MIKLFSRHTIHKIFVNEVGQLRRILIGMGLSPLEGEDFLQDVYQEALENSPEDRGQAAIYNWLRRVTINRAMLHFRRKRVRQHGLNILQYQQHSAIPEPPILVARDEETEALRGCLAQMPNTTRIPLVLRYFGARWDCRTHGSDFLRGSQLFGYAPALVE